ncbi:hypothetical protein CC78DRAFT_568495 [Lojkania enalia]|uniref:Uncharacterized protein n=1 Tax=Lojkania enalia TaxID=147567 RepID=A0A9P4KCX9_9PLEO|nr:hypothetical protein CC78DRAFT_568495 [Didymosphaeria enalia]
MTLDPFSVAAAVAGLVKLAGHIREKGFKKANSSSQRYLEFYNALYQLKDNLETIQRITQEADEKFHQHRLGSYGPSSYDLTPLQEIIGNLKLTIEECQQWLHDNRKFEHRNGVITNIIYNIDIDPEAVQLTQKLSFHNVKIGLVLQPFQLYLQSQIGSLNDEQHQNTAERLQRIEELITPRIDSPVDRPSAVPPRDLIVPLELADRFKASLRDHPDFAGKTIDDITLQDGLDAFFMHFNSMPQVLDASSYLRLMKSIWIMDVIRQSKQWAKIQRTSPGGLYDRCIREMDRRLRKACTEAGELPLPSLPVVLLLPPENFSIWPTRVREMFDFDFNDFGVLLDIPILPDTQEHKLRVVENIDGTWGVEDMNITTVEAATGVSTEKFIQRLNIDPKSAFFVPIYAIPAEPHQNRATLTIKLQSSQDGVNGITPEFKSLPDLWRLQHLVTGYRCLGQRIGVETRSLAKGQYMPNSKPKAWYKIWSGSEMVLERGNIQFWRKEDFQKPVPPSEDDKRPQSLVDRRASLVPRAIERRTSKTPTDTSVFSMSSHQTSSTSDYTKPFSSPDTKEISIGSSTVAYDIQEPRPSLLILFLQQTSTGLLSFLVIELDENTLINPQGCDCRNSNERCRVSVLERSGSPLLARRFYARNGLNSWNLAAIGDNFASPKSDYIRVQDMNWLEISFASGNEKAQFNQSVTNLVDLYTGRLIAYRRDLIGVRATHIVTQ